MGPLSDQAFSQAGASVFLLVQNSQKAGNILNVRLSGATEYELVELFGKIISNSQGVLAAKRHGSRIIPDNPSACFAVWQVRVQDSDPSRLQANIVKNIRKIRSSGGKTAVRGNGQGNTNGDADLLEGIRPRGISGI